MSQVFSTYKLVLEFSEIKIQRFPRGGVFPAVSSNCAVAGGACEQRGLAGLPQRSTGMEACARESCFRGYGTGEAISLQGRFMMPFAHLWAVKSQTEE